MNKIPNYNPKEKIVPTRGRYFHVQEKDKVKVGVFVKNHRFLLLLGFWAVFGRFGGISSDFRIPGFREVGCLGM